MSNKDYWIQGCWIEPTELSYPLEEKDGNKMPAPSPTDFRFEKQERRKFEKASVIRERETAGNKICQQFLIEKSGNEDAGSRVAKTKWQIKREAFWRKKEKDNA
jgi:hypothetical protein